MNPLENKLMVVAAIVGLALQMLVTEIPYLTQAFGTAHLSLNEWLHLGILAAFPLLAHEILILLSFEPRRKY
jgi:Ca2+-transporting ATPase